MTLDTGYTGKAAVLRVLRRRFSRYEGEGLATCSSYDDAVSSIIDGGISRLHKAHDRIEQTLLDTFENLPATSCCDIAFDWINVGAKEVVENYYEMV